MQPFFPLLLGLPGRLEQLALRLDLGRVFPSLTLSFPFVPLSFAFKVRACVFRVKVVGVRSGGGQSSGVVLHVAAAAAAIATTKTVLVVAIDRPLELRWRPLQLGSFEWVIQ